MGAMSKRQDTRGTKRRRVLAALLALPAVAVLALGIFIHVYGQVERARPAPVIIVLGASVLAGGIAGDSLTARTRHAVDLYHRGIAPYLLFTGGVGDHPPAESEVAARLARASGVPARAILCEARSTSTAENIRYAADICRAHDWTTAVVVSDPYHLWRARFLLARQGITADTSPALTCLRQRDPWLRLLWTARETLLVIRDAVVAW